MQRFFEGPLLSTVLLLVAPLQLLAEQTISVLKIDGTLLSGQLQQWQAGEITLSEDEKITSLRVEDVHRIDWPSNQQSPDHQTGTGVLSLVDETLIPIDDYEVSDHMATVKTPLATEPLSITTEKIRVVHFGTDPLQSTALGRRLEDKQLTSDLLVIRKKKGGLLDYILGVAGDVAADRVHFTWENETIPVKRNKVAAIAYYHARMTEQPLPRCWLLTTSGARLPVAELSFSSDHVRVTTIDQIHLSIRLDSLASADFSVGKLVYLSDLTPLREKWTPRIALPTSAQLIQKHGRPRRNQSFEGSLISLAWPAIRSGSANQKITTYDKGLALRSRTELVYRLPAKMRRFVALAGIDPATAGEGHVKLTVFADQHILWEGEIDGSTPPVEISTPFKNTRRLRILVDYGANLDYGDRLHLAEARVIK